MKFCRIILLVFMPLAVIGQIPFDSQVTQFEMDVPNALERNILRLIIYNTSDDFLIKGIENKIALRCGDLTQNKIVLENNANIKRIMDTTPWKPKNQNFWTEDIDFNDGIHEPWVDIDSVKWRRTYVVEPGELDPITFKAFYLVNSDSVYIGSIRINVIDNVLPKLNISEKEIYPFEISREALFNIKNLKGEFDFDHPEPLKYGEIVYFEFECWKGKKLIESYKCYCDFLSYEMLRTIKNCRKGSLIRFKNITTREANLGAVEFRVK